MKERQIYLDVMRGFTMFLVVFGHIGIVSFGIAPYDSVVMHFFVTFRMPMFFFLSGYLGYKAIQFWDYNFFKERLKVKSFVQLVPMITFFSIFQISHGKNPIDSFLSGGLSGYWFTFVLFEMFLIYYSVALISHYFGKNLFIVLIPIALMGGVFLVIMPRTGKLYEVLSLENLFKYFQFFVLGIFFKKYNSQMIEKLKKEKIKLILVVSFMLMYISICTGVLDSLHIVYHMVHDEIIRYVGVLLVFAFFIHIKDVINVDSTITKAFSYTGKHTLDIYLLHHFFLPDLKIFKCYFENNQQPLLEFIIYALIAILIIAVCLGIQYVLSISSTLRYWLFGKRG